MLWQIVSKARLWPKRAGKHHQWLDKLVGTLRGKTIPYFKDGFGDTSVPESFGKWLNLYAQASKERKKIYDSIELPRFIEPQFHSWLKGKFLLKTLYNINLVEGTFKTTALEIEHMLPKECVQSRFLLVLPEQSLSIEDVFMKKIPVVIILPGTGDHGYNRRLQTVAAPLAKQAGIASIIYESPFYGARKPPNQFGSKLRKVSDLPVLGRVTIEESLSIIKWLHHKGAGPMVVAGCSMGGLHAAMIASLYHEQIGVVSWCAPPSAGPVFSEGLLSGFCAWKNLEKSARELALLRNDMQEDVKELMKKFLSITDIERFPSPARPDKAVIVLGKSDLYVEYNKAASRWLELRESKWKGADVRWNHGGHVSESLFSLDEMVNAIIDVVKRIENDDKSM